MYSQRWSPGLRQGDIFGEVAFPLTTAQLRQTTPASSWLAPGAGQTQVRAVEVPVKPVLAVVLSHDCEFNENKRDQFLVARTRGLDPRHTEDELDELRAGNRAEERAREGLPLALDTFFLEPLAGVFDAPRLVDFCTITAFPMTVCEEARQVKKAELEHEHRVLLREKVALFFSREADDVPDEEKEDAPTFVG